MLKISLLKKIIKKDSYISIFTAVLYKFE